MQMMPDMLMQKVFFFILRTYPKFIVNIVEEQVSFENCIDIAIKSFFKR